MRKLLSLCIGMMSIGLQAADTVFVKTPQVPILIERHDNVLAYLRLDAKETQTLENVTLTFDKNVPLSQIKAVKLYYGGTDAPQDRGKNGSLRWNTFLAILLAKPCRQILLIPSRKRR